MLEVYRKYETSDSIRLLNQLFLLCSNVDCLYFKVEKSVAISVHYRHNGQFPGFATHHNFIRPFPLFQCLWMSFICHFHLGRTRTSLQPNRKTQTRCKNLGFDWNHFSLGNSVFLSQKAVSLSSQSNIYLGCPVSRFQKACSCNCSFLICSLHPFPVGTPAQTTQKSYSP